MPHPPHLNPNHTTIPTPAAATITTPTSANTGILTRPLPLTPPPPPFFPPPPPRG
ncbi:Protein of unknown function [Pyronema omphalodes CBS 100304]|uniref:Uncharacterized protein n=1 Tax=Pyronema omphalodes (strain CBS 100304) TaxID=1076935 RepID=U4LU48_PYROM|nr:Protein of unknown function [Pyronema omphalodes CBS 100304]